MRPNGARMVYLCTLSAVEKNQMNKAVTANPSSFNPQCSLPNAEPQTLKPHRRTGRARGESGAPLCLSVCLSLFLFFSLSLSDLALHSFPKSIPAQK